MRATGDELPPTKLVVDLLNDAVGTGGDGRG
jgi:hypothetical protein